MSCPLDPQPLISLLPCLFASLPPPLLASLPLAHRTSRSCATSESPRSTLSFRTVPPIKTLLPSLALALLFPLAFVHAQDVPAPHLASPVQAKSPGKDSQSSAAAPDYSKQPYVMELISSKVVVENDGTSTADVLLRTRVQSQAGLRAVGLLSVPFTSKTEAVDILFVRVTKPDGRVIDTPLDNVLEVPTEITRQAPYYSDLKEKQIAVKGLEIGDTVEFSRREHVHTPLDPGQFWYTYNFFRAGIVLEERLEIDVPKARYVKVESPKFPPEITEQGSYKVFKWKASNLEVKDPKSDPAEVDQDAAQPAIQLTSFKDWNEVGDWFSSLFASREVVTPEIQQKADEITRGATKDSEKIQALYTYVSTKFRYIGVALGIGRYQPHSATDVLTNDYGDCKDKHTLFASLLAAVGIKSYPTLISSAAKTDTAVPSPMQFNHVISALPQKDGLLFLDTTTEVGPFGYLADALRDKQALVLAGEGKAQFVKTPPDPPFQSFFAFETDGTLDDSGTWKSHSQITLRGDAEVAYRVTFRQAAQPQWTQVMQQISANLNFGGTVSDVTLSSIDSTDQPFRVEYNYTREAYGDWENRRIIMPSPPLFLPEAPEVKDAKKPPKPLKLGSPSEARYHGTMKLPAGSRPHLLPPLDLRESFAEYQSKYSFANGVLQFDRHLITKSREISPEQLESYRKFIKAIVADVTTFITLRAEDFASADTSDNADAQEFYRQGGEAWRRNDVLEAARLYQRALDKDPNFAGPMFWLGAAHFSTGKADEGIAEMKKSLALNPSQRDHYQYLCSLLSSRHRDDEALELWKQLHKENPDDSLASDNIVRILFSLKRYSEALPELKDSAERRPDVARVQLQLGEAYALSGDVEKAKVALDKAFELDSSSATLNSVAYILAENNIQLDDALKYAQKAVAEIEDKTSAISLDNLLPEDVTTASALAAYWDTLGWVYFRKNQFDLAEKYLNAAWLLSLDPVIADHLGQAYEKRGKKHDALVAYSRALAADHAPSETQSRFDALRTKADTKPFRDWADLQQQRTYHLGRLAKAHASAEFYVLIKPAPKAPDVQFISGSENIKSAAEPIAALKFNVSFPDSGDTQILRRGILDCEPELSGCVFVLIPPTSVQFTKLPDPK